MCFLIQIKIFDYSEYPHYVEGSDDGGGDRRCCHHFGAVFLSVISVFDYHALGPSVGGIIND